MSEVAVESGFAADEQELNVWNRSVSMELSKLRIKGATGKRDLIVAQGIQTLDSLDQTVNLFMGRLREWYGVYFPELDRLIEKHETYSRLVVNLGNRESFTVENLEAENIPKERTQLVAKAAESSMGADIAERDLAQVQHLAKDVLAFYLLRKNMEEYVDNTMEEMAPNVRAVAGALLGARMISHRRQPTKPRHETSKHHPSLRRRKSTLPLTKNRCKTTKTRLNLPAHTAP